jgi:outer membrane lipoprotein carrier protein
MKTIAVLCVMLAGVLGGSNGSMGAQQHSAVLDKVISGIEERYQASGFTADFDQTSTIKAMEISDYATGRVFFKRPGMMRWEYETPEKQLILTDGKKLWIYRPEDSQVLVGKAPVYFGDGRGASFLADVKLIREKFDLSLEAEKDVNYHKLKLIPREKSLELTSIYLWVSKKTFDVIQISTFNSYKDETRIIMKNIQFKDSLEDSLFRLKVPPKTDVQYLDEDR